MNYLNFSMKRMIRVKKYNSTIGNGGKFNLLFLPKKKKKHPYFSRNTNEGKRRELSTFSFPFKNSQIRQLWVPSSTILFIPFPLNSIYECKRDKT